MRSVFRRISARDGGFTVIELTVASAILLIVVTALLSTFASAQRSSAFAQERAQVLDEMRLTMARLTKEIRQASAIDSASTASRLQVTTYVGGEEKEILFEVVGSELRRSEVNKTGYTVLQQDLDSSAIFAYTLPTEASPVEDARVVTLNLAVHPERRPDTVIELTSEVRLRNLGGAT